MDFTISIKLINILLLLIYSSYVFRVIIPLIDYTLNFNYIITELCEQKGEVENTCLGKCHLSKELKKQSESLDGNKVIVKIDFLKIPHIFYLNSNSLITENKDIFTTHLVKKEIQFGLAPNLPPPKILLI